MASFYRLVLADDNALFRHTLKRLLLERPELEVAGEAGDGLELLEFLALNRPAANMAIIDLSMPYLGGIEATSRIKSAYPRMKVLILSIHREKEYIAEALSAGADGYVLKDHAAIELLTAIERIRQDRIYISPLLTENQSLNN